MSVKGKGKGKRESVGSGELRAFLRKHVRERSNQRASSRLDILCETNWPFHQRTCASMARSTFCCSRRKRVEYTISRNGAPVIYWRKTHRKPCVHPTLHEEGVGLTVYFSSAFERRSVNFLAAVADSGYRKRERSLLEYCQRFRGLLKV